MGYNGRSLRSYFKTKNAEFFPQTTSSSKGYDSENNAVTQSASDTSDKDKLVFRDDSGNVINSYDAVPADTTVTLTSNDDYSNYSADDDESYTIADTIGYANGHPNCLRIRIGRGHITVHAAPLVTSNYFLLQDGNINYLAGIWQSLPNNITRIYWTDFLIRSGEDTNPNALWNYPATRWGMLLCFFLAAVYILFTIRRKQRIVPIIEPLRNDTVSFVETVGRLYYNKGNNANLAEKMIQQYLEWVRMNCYINTSMLNESFVQQLAMKSGQPVATVSELVNMIHEIRTSHTKIDDAYLYQLYRTIQQFYKNHHQ